MTVPVCIWVYFVALNLVLLFGDSRITRLVQYTVVVGAFYLFRESVNRSIYSMYGQYHHTHDGHHDALTLVTRPATKLFSLSLYSNLFIHNK
jgi:hypothetical protein